MTPVLSGHPHWRRLLVAVVALPLVVVLAVLVFAWPAARVAPRDVPVGFVGTGAASQQAAAALEAAAPGAFELRLYADRPNAEQAIETRDVDGAFVVAPGSVTVLDASAGSPAVAQVLTGVGAELGAQAHADVRTVDVVPLSHDDPRGTVFSSALLPLTICGVLVAAAAALVFGFRPAWRQLAALAVISLVAGAGVYAVVQGFLGALPHQALATWLALSLVLLAISTAGAGLVALIGAPGLAVAGLIMVFLGNPSSGVTSSPDLLPTAVGHFGQWLPPGAAANLLRSTAYFDGNGAGSPLAVLVAWVVLGAVAVVVGHRRLGAREKTAGEERDAIPVHRRYSPEATPLAS